MPKLINIPQNTDEWLLFRHHGVGGSDIPVILGVSKFKRKKRLFGEKIKPNPPKSQSTFITDLGHACEKDVRPYIELQKLVECTPVLIVDDDYDFMKCSLDGFDEEEKIVWECKMTGHQKFNALKKGIISDDFLVQIQYQLYVSKSKYANLTAVLFENNGYDLSNRITIEIYPDEEIQSEIVTKVKDFWKDVRVASDSKRS